MGLEGGGSSLTSKGRNGHALSVGALGRAASGGAFAPEPPRVTRIQPEPRGARRRRALVRRRRAPTGSDQSHEDGANRGDSLMTLPSR